MRYPRDMAVAGSELSWVVPAIYVVVCLAIASAVMLFGWSATWSSLGIPALEPVFADSRSLQGALISIAQGHDPQLLNPGDPWALMLALSPALMLLVERGNNDLAMFSLVFLAGWLTSLQGRTAIFAAKSMLFLLMSGMLLSTTHVWLRNGARPELM